MQQGENEVERLTKDELESFVQKLQSYDRNGGTPDGKLDMDEINDFVRDFNSEHPNERITSEDVFQFVNNIFTKNSLYNKPIKSGQGIQKVGEPLSTKTVRLQCMDENSDIVEIVLEISLYATEDETTPLLYENKVVQGAQYKNLLASKYGYTGDDAWSNFTTGSLRPPNPDTYEVNFFPIAKDSMSVGSNGDMTATPVVQGLDSADGIVSYYMPNGFDRDPQAILAEYQNPKAQQTMNDFIEYMYQALEDTEKALDECIDTFGFSANAAEWISKLWNSSDECGDGTREQVRNSIAHAKIILSNMESADNSMDGILSGKDFGAFYKELTGIDFRVQKIVDFIQARDEYISQQATLTMYDHVHSTLNNAVQFFEQSMAMPDIIENDNTWEIYPTNNVFDLSKKVARQSLGDAFYPLLGISTENWDKMLNELEEKGIDTVEFCKNLAKNLSAMVDEQAKNVFGPAFPNDMKNKMESTERYYESTRSAAVGKGDMMNVVQSYYNSNMVGGSVVLGVGQMAVYAALMSVCPAAIAGLSIEGLGSIGAGFGAGVWSGASYAASYVLAEGVDRMTNNIDDSIDLWNSEAQGELWSDAAIEFVAGYLFDGALKSKIFGKTEKNLLKTDAAMSAERNILNPTKVGELGYEKFHQLFTKDKIKQFLVIRGLAGVIGGSKDASKETFKETLRSKYNLSFITITFLVGSIANACFIKFKNSPFVKQNHKIMGKFIEKGSKTVKKGFKDSNESLTQDEQAIQNLLGEMKTTIREEMTSKLKDSPDYEQIRDILDNEDKLNNLIIDFYLVDLLNGFGDE